MEGPDEREAATGGSKEELAWRIQLSLRRSQARAEVLRFLAQKGPAYVTLIAQGTGLHLNSVVGALRGLGDRYRPDLSLLALSLVEEVDVEPGHASEGVRLYAPTEHGRRVAEEHLNGN